jgi:hypothetical protein
MKKVLPAFVAAAAVAFSGCLLLVLRHGARQSGPRTQPTNSIAAGTNDPVKAASIYKDFIHTHADQPVKEVQDQVGSARMHLAYLQAQRGDFNSARSTFLDAQREYRGTGAKDPAYGSIPDQAAYQAAVCLQGEGKREQARRAYIAFLREHPLSPLVMAAKNRCDRLNGGVPDPAVDELLQEAITKQEQSARFEMATCGPKTMAYLLPLLGKPPKDYHELAKLCNTDASGTTLENMRQGFHNLGVASYGLKVNRRDFASLPLPAVLVSQGHFVALTKVEKNSATVYDTLYSSTRKISLPPFEDASFLAVVLVFALPTLNEKSR